MQAETKTYVVKRVRLWNAGKLFKVTDLLYRCGKDMAKKFDLHHWDNSRLKTFAIVCYCSLKNKIYAVFDGQEKTLIATFQTRKNKTAFLFQKLATLPEAAGKGVGSFCLSEIEKMARQAGCKEVVCEVYDKSEHAKVFYERRGYSVFGETKTLKYGELKLKKEF